MKQKRKSPAAVKVIACLLLLGSLACLLLPWMKLSIDTSRGRMSPGELLDSVGQFVGLDRDTLSSELIGELNALQAQTAGGGIAVEANTVFDLLSRALDGHFSLPDFAIICGELSQIAVAVGERDQAAPLATARMAIWILLGLLAVLWIVALCCQLSDHKGGILPYLLLAALVTVGLLLLRAMANQYLREEAYAMLDELGAGMLISYLGIDLEIVKMGYAAYLCPTLALLAMLLMCIRKKNPQPEASPYPARKTPGTVPTGTGEEPVRRGWRCPNCGRVCHPDSEACDLCGTARPRRPAAVYCPECGARMPRGAIFCTECGSPIQDPDAGFDLTGEMEF